VDSKEASRSASTSGSVERSRKDTLQLFDVTTRDARNGELIGGARLMVLAL